jgi:hypothetical protein
MPGEKPIEHRAPFLSNGENIDFNTHSKPGNFAISEMPAHLRHLFSSSESEDDGKSQETGKTDYRPDPYNGGRPPRNPDDPYDAY